MIFKDIIIVYTSATCVSLGLNTPYPNNDTDDMNKLLEDIEVDFFLVVFNLF